MPDLNDLHQEGKPLVDLGPAPLAVVATTMPPVELQPLDMGYIWRMCEGIAGTDMVPAHLKTPGAAVATILAGHELGLKPMAALRSIHLVKGKVVIAADAQLALLHQHGIRSRWVESSRIRATVELMRPEGGAWVAEEFTYTFDDAKAADLTGKDVWRKHLRAMLRARCVSSAAKMFAPGVLMGVYIPDEGAEFSDAVVVPHPDPAHWEHSEAWFRDSCDAIGWPFDEVVDFLASCGGKHPSAMKLASLSKLLVQLRNPSDTLEARIEAWRNPAEVGDVEIGNALAAAEENARGAE